MGIRTLGAAAANVNGILSVNEIKARTGQQLVLNAGEAGNYPTSQTFEYVYVNAEEGLQVNSSSDNWVSGWAGRKTTTIDDIGVTTDGGYNLQAGQITSRFDVTGLTYKDQALLDPVVDPQGIYFKPDGLKMFLISSSSDAVHEFNLSTAYDITTAVAGVTFSVAGQETGATGLHFNAAGTRMYIVGQTGDGIDQYNLSTAWNISTASASTFRVLTAAEFPGLPGSETGVSAIHLDATGTRMYITGTALDRVLQFSLSVANEISSATYVTSYATNVFPMYESAPTGVWINTAGTRMYVAGQSSDAIIQYDLGTTWDVSTAVFSGSAHIWTQCPTVSGLHITEANGYAFVCGTSTDDVFRFAFEPSLAFTAEYLNGRVVVDGPSTFTNGRAYFEEPIYVNAGTSILKTTSIEGNLTVSGTMTTNGLSRTEYGRQTSTAAQTIDSNDDGYMIRHTGATGVTYTCNSGIPDGHQVTFIQDDAGEITFAAGTGVTIKSKGGKLKTNGQYSAVTLLAYSTTEYYLIGDLA